MIPLAHYIHTSLPNSGYWALVIALIAVASAATWAYMEFRRTKAWIEDHGEDE
ncbi:MAG: hypothetical protein HQ478_09875 [Chloroflexi bacterium]|nr:hypothetical protein [Chloroflexota bacterium]